jgi:hypothetical protein
MGYMKGKVAEIKFEERSHRELHFERALKEVEEVAGAKTLRQKLAW